MDEATFTGMEMGKMKLVVLAITTKLVKMGLEPI